MKKNIFLFLILLTFFSFFLYFEQNSRLQLSTNLFIPLKAKQPLVERFLESSKHVFKSKAGLPLRHYGIFDPKLQISNSLGVIRGVAFGDVHYTRGFTYDSNALTPTDYFSCLQKDGQNIFKGFDLVGINLETSIATKEECQFSEKSILFRTEPKYLRDFKRAGFNLLGLSNNHSYDCGFKGYEATKKHLKSENIDFFGEEKKDISNILKKEINGTKVAFMGMEFITSKRNLQSKYTLIGQLKKQGYIVIMNIHWGTEYKLKANDYQKKLAREFIDAGVNMIIGHHPHVVQDYEIYKGVPIFYSLGNFIFDQPFQETLPGNALIYEINGVGVTYTLLEFKRDPKTYGLVCER